MLPQHTHRLVIYVLWCTMLFIPNPMNLKPNFLSLIISPYRFVAHYVTIHRLQTLIRSSPTLVLYLDILLTHILSHYISAARDYPMRIQHRSTSTPYITSYRTGLVIDSVDCRLPCRGQFQCSQFQHGQTNDLSNWSLLLPSLAFSINRITHGWIAQGQDNAIVWGSRS